MLLIKLLLTCVPMEGIFGVGCVVVQLVQADRVGLVFRPEELGDLSVWPRGHVEMALQQGLMFPLDVAGPHLLEERLGSAALVLAAPDPGVAVPERRQEVDAGLVGSTVSHGDANQDVLGA